MTEKQRVNMDIDKDLWKEVTVRAAEEEKEKREYVEESLRKNLNSKEEKKI